MRIKELEEVMAIDNKRVSQLEGDLSIAQLSVALKGLLRFRLRSCLMPKSFRLSPML